jgi:futalosine hydrolase
MLIGIAGSYDLGAAPVGSVVIGIRATCDGIGAGTGNDFVAAGAMGWSQGHARKGIQPVQDTIELDSWLIDDLPRSELTDRVFFGGEVLSVSAASGSADDAQTRRIRYAEALIEDMEAFAVALATRLSGGSLTLIRGVSNAVGDREHRNWKTGAALGAVSRVLAAAIGLAGSHHGFS